MSVTGWDNGLCQDYSRGLSRWFASRIDARHTLRRWRNEGATMTDAKELREAAQAQIDRWKKLMFGPVDELRAALGQPAEGGEHPPHRLCDCAACAASFVDDATPPASHSQAQQPHDMAGMLERGATAWAGVDPQELRAGGQSRLSEKFGQEQPSAHITEPYSVAEIKARIASHDYNAELLLQHAMLHLEQQPSGEVVLPDGWVPLTIEHELGYPEDVAYGPQRMMDRLKKWLDRHFAALATPKPEPMTWQPIKTAPKDGTQILAFDGKAITTAFWGRSNPMNRAAWIGGHCKIDHIDQPTFWMPLPPAPTTTTTTTTAIHRKRP